MSRNARSWIPKRLPVLTLPSNTCPNGRSYEWELFGEVFSPWMSRAETLLLSAGLRDRIQKTYPQNRIHCKTIVSFSLDEWQKKLTKYWWEYRWVESKHQPTTGRWGKDWHAAGDMYSIREHFDITCSERSANKRAEIMNRILTVCSNVTIALEPYLMMRVKRRVWRLLLCH